MAKGSNQKLKLLYLAKILMDETDDEHGISTPDIIAKLATNDIAVDRKTLYTDFEELRRFGIDVVGEQTGKGYLYHVASRDFELAELKLLVDSVQAAKFITEKKSRELIKKLESLVSIHEAKQLHRQVLIGGRVKTMNESIYYNVDKIHTAINANSQIRFQYFQWNVDKEQELRHGGSWYHASPWYLIWDDEYYYLVAYDAENGIIKHYRVDKMLRITVTGKEREGEDSLSGLDAAAYSKAMFGMFGGEKVPVVIEAENQFVGVLIDRFGKDITISKTDEAHFRTTVDVVPSEIFIGWVMSFGAGMRIVGPDEVVQTTRQLVERLRKIYCEDSQ
jgi:predicted DNA-binding transcriptional regulator YafY